MGEASSKGRWIKLYCKITEWEWYNDLATRVVFLHLLFTANWKPTTWKNVQLDRGQRIITIRNLADECQLTEQQTKTALKHLESTQTITRTSTPKYSIVTLNNYDEYQGDNTDSNTEITREVTHNQHADAPTTNTGYRNIEDRNIEFRNKNNVRYSADFEELWGCYPRKSDKGMAYKQYSARIKGGFSPDEILQAVKSYATECKKKHTEQQYIKHCKTFLGPSTPFLDYLPKGGNDSYIGKSEGDPNPGGNPFENFRRRC